MVDCGFDGSAEEMPVAPVSDSDVIPDVSTSVVATVTVIGACVIDGMMNTGEDDSDEVLAFGEPFEASEPDGMIDTSEDEDELGSGKLSEVSVVDETIDLRDDGNRLEVLRWVRLLRPEYSVIVMVAGQVV